MTPFCLIVGGQDIYGHGSRLRGGKAAVLGFGSSLGLWVFPAKPQQGCTVTCGLLSCWHLQDLCSRGPIHLAWQAQGMTCPAQNIKFHTRDFFDKLTSCLWLTLNIWLETDLTLAPHVKLSFFPILHTIPSPIMKQHRIEISFTVFKKSNKFTFYPLSRKFFSSLRGSWRD